MAARRPLAVLLGAAALLAGCASDDKLSAEERVDRVERRYERLWDAESVRCWEAPGGEGYRCRIVSKQKRPAGPQSSYDVITPPEP